MLNIRWKLVFIMVILEFRSLFICKFEVSGFTPSLKCQRGKFRRPVFVTNIAKQMIKKLLLIIKSKKVKKRTKFKNFIFQFFYMYLNTNFAGHLEKNECSPELLSNMSAFTPSAHFIYYFHKIEKKMCFILIICVSIQNKILSYIDIR